MPIPETDWFRPIRRKEMCRSGDTRRWLWVAEPVRGRISGVGVRVSEVIIEDLGGEEHALKLLDRVAEAEVRRRVEAGEVVPEGSEFEVFLWNPIMTRHEDGSIEVVPGLIVT